MSANERLQDLQTALDKHGVQDVKFFFAYKSDTPTSHRVADVEHFLNSSLSGNVEEMPLLGDIPPG